MKRFPFEDAGRKALRPFDDDGLAPSRYPTGWATSAAPFGWDEY